MDLGEGRQIADGRVPPAGIVPSLDELEDGHARLGLRAAAVPVEELAFKGGEEALSDIALS